MGCFDTVNFDCPECGSEISLQSKGGKCELREYKVGIGRISASTLAYLHGDKVTCDKCQSSFVVKVKAKAKLKRIEVEEHCEYDWGGT